MKNLSLMHILNEEQSQPEKNMDGDNSMIAIYCPIRLGSHLLGLFEDAPGDALKPQHFHVTIGLIHNHKGNEKRIQRILDAAAKKLKPVRISIRSFGAFPPNEHNGQKWVLHAKPECEDFESIHHHVLSKMKKHGIEIDNGSFDFSPHITIKYCDEKPDLNKKINASWTARKIAFAVGPRKHEEIMG